MDVYGAMRIAFLAFLFGWFSWLQTPSKAEDGIKSGGLSISQASIDLIIEYEVGGGKGYYDKYLSRPTVPPGFSGTTIGLGVDLGYYTQAQIKDMLNGLIPESQVKRLMLVAGKKGSAAKASLPSVRDIIIPWDVALKVYYEKTIPSFAKLTNTTYPGLSSLHPHIQGVMLSTTFNRGPSLAGDRRKELLWSRNDIKVGKYAKLPSYQLQMRRLWPDIKGLQRRYTSHAALMQRVVDGKP